ncbi:two-component SAPR family response regulator [Skermanella aerolata]|uniref:response regulator n=1 Tax=Skermanella aerolata TaxID=393310 RepID=UPI003D214891
MRILIVEDEMIVAWNIQSTLENAGHIVVGIAMSFSEASRMIEDSCPELALVNINLKEGKGAGIDFARDLLDHCAVPSLFVSGQIKEARENKDVALGFLGKPWRSRTLLDSVDVAHRLINGEDPEPVPPGLELFRNTDN